MSAQDYNKNIDRSSTALVLANGNYPSKNKIKKIAVQASFILCADGGAQKARELKILPDIIMGDMDSIDRETMAYYNKAHVAIQKIPAQDNNDLEKAILYLIDHNYQHIILLGAVGDRIDQSFTSFQLVQKYSAQLGFSLYSPNSEILLLKKGQHLIKTAPGQMISLFAFPVAEGVTTRDLKFALQQETLKPGSQGVSNQALAHRIMISLSKGQLLLFKISDSP